MKHNHKEDVERGIELLTSYIQNTGIAARAAYAIGLHRTEINSRFGPDIHTRR